MPHILKSQARLIANKLYRHTYPDKHCLVFIHIPKNAGTSIRELIIDQQLKILIVGHDIRDKFYCYPHHFLTVDDPSAFCIVRNPFDRLYSCYIYLTRGKHNSFDALDAKKWCAAHTTFEQFVKQGLADYGTEIFQQIHFKPQLAWISKPNGNRTVKDINILSFENLETDFYAYLDKNNIAYQKSLKKLNRATQANYRTMYDAEMVNIVAELYQQDLAAFAYEF